MVKELLNKLFKNVNINWLLLYQLRGAVLLKIQGGAKLLKIQSGEDFRNSLTV